MALETLMIDLYQLATLLAHHKTDPDRLKQHVNMSFFSRKIPTNRNYIVFSGLRSVLEHMKNLRTYDFISVMMKHPMLGPVFKENTGIFQDLNLSAYKKDFNLTSVPEGTLIFAAPGYRVDGAPFIINDQQVKVYEPYMQVDCSFILSKLIETPFLSYINYESMVASKASRVVHAANGKPVLEFGQRRAHAHAALDASYAAYIAGCSGTSNVAAFMKYGIPALGTMDHFAVMASEREGVPRSVTESEFFKNFTEMFPQQATLLVDTYDTHTGILNAVAATRGKLTGIRLDSNVNVESVKDARRLLALLNASHVKIFVSDGLNENKVKELEPYVDGFGVGENITCSPDSATGVGAVGKLIVNGYGKSTIKVSSGSGKMTLPGPVQIYRFKDYDLIALENEPAPEGAKALLGKVDPSFIPDVEETRKYVMEQVKALPTELTNINPNLHNGTRKIIVSDKFAELTESLVKTSHG